MIRKIRTVLYPFDEANAPLLHYEDCLNNIEIVAVSMPQGWGKPLHLCNKVDIHETKDMITNNIELVWMIESSNSITLEELCNQVEKFTESIKQIVITRKLSLIEWEKINSICMSHCVEILNLDDFFCTCNDKEFLEKQNGNLLKEIGVPIVAVAGMGENSNKFEVLLQISKLLKMEGYKVSTVGSRYGLEMIGMHSFPEFMFRSKLNEEKKIIYYNNYIKYIEEEEKPDIIVIGVPGGSLPVTKRQTEHFGISAFEIFNAIQPDYLIYTLYNIEAEEKYLDEIKNLVKYRFGIEIDSFYIANFIQDGLSLNTFMPIKYIHQDISNIETRWSKSNENIYFRGREPHLVNNIIDILNEYKEVEIL